MFQRELLYAAGGGGLHLAGRGTGGSGASCRPAGDASGPADRITFAGGCSRRTGLPGGRETGTSRLQTHRSRRENQGEPAKKTCRTFQKFSCRFGQSAEDSPRAWVDIDIHHGLW